MRPISTQAQANTHSSRRSSEQKPRLRFLCSMAPSPETGPALENLTEPLVYSLAPQMWSVPKPLSFSPAFHFSTEASILAQAKSTGSPCSQSCEQQPLGRGWVTEGVISGPTTKMEAISFFLSLVRGSWAFQVWEGGAPWVRGYAGMSGAHVPTSHTLHSWFKATWLVTSRSWMSLESTSDGGKL